MTSQEKAFRDFAKFVGGLKGDEKSEAQTFLFFGLDVNDVGSGRENLSSAAGASTATRQVAGSLGLEPQVHERL